jgi:hypothetical protein
MFACVFFHFFSSFICSKKKILPLQEYVNKFYIKNSAEDFIPLNFNVEKKEPLERGSNTIMI